MNSAPWSKLRQTDPPDFGRAKRVPRWWLNYSVYRRSAKAAKIICRAREICDFETGVVSIVILSCRRLAELQRLVTSLRFFLENIEDYTKIEKVLVDNGSGPDLIGWAKNSSFFNRIIAHEHNLGMAVALDNAFPQVNGEYIMLVEEDFVIDYQQPFLQRCFTLFDEYPEIGIIRLKDQRNWGKPHRIIGPERQTTDGTEFWTWLPSFNGKLNIWAAGSVLFRKVSFMSTGHIPFGPNLARNHPLHQGVLYEELYGKRYNRNWLAAKVRNCCPFIQPNDNQESSGWGEIHDGVKKANAGSDFPTIIWRVWLHVRLRLQNQMIKFFGLSDHKTRLLKKLPVHSTGVEIGVWKGAFSEQILKILLPRKLYLVDPWAFQPQYSGRWYGGVKAKSQLEMDNIFREVVDKFSGLGCEIFRGRSTDFFLNFKNKVDWVYIDGNHSYEFVLADLEGALGITSEWGIIVGDDFFYQDVMVAVDEFCKKKGLKFSVIGTQFIIKKCEL